jgi:hypothetical protein
VLLVNSIKKVKDKTFSNFKIQVRPFSDDSEISVDGPTFGRVGLPRPRTESEFSDGFTDDVNYTVVPQNQSNVVTELNAAERDADKKVMETFV